MFRLKEEAARCLLCLEGACTAACEKGFDPARAVRAIRFENEAGAGNFIDKGVCSECTGNCENVCIHYDRPIRIREMASMLPEVAELTQKAGSFNRFLWSSLRESVFSVIINCGRGL